MSPAARPLLVGLDGRSGAGKSTVAEALAARVAPAARVAVLALDEMYPGWDGLAAVLAPDGPYAAAVHALAAGRTARWRTWDWHRSRPGPERALAAADVDLVVCEGVGALCAAARDALDLRVWAQQDPAVRRARALARDGEAYRPHWQRWAAQEERYLAADAPERAADLCIRI